MIKKLFCILFVLSVTNFIHTRERCPSGQGMYEYDGKLVCEDCKDNTFKLEIGDGHCKACPINTYRNNEKTEESKLRFLTENIECVACEAGTKGLGVGQGCSVKAKPAPVPSTDESSTTTESSSSVESSTTSSSDESSTTSTNEESSITSEESSTTSTNEESSTTSEESSASSDKSSQGFGIKCFWFNGDITFNLSDLESKKEAKVDQDIELSKTKHFYYNFCDANLKKCNDKETQFAYIHNENTCLNLAGSTLSNNNWDTIKQEGKYIYLIIILIIISYFLYFSPRKKTKCR